MNGRERISLEKFITVMMDERDRRYEQRFLAQETAIAAAFKSADIAINKAEAASIRDKASSNEWREAMNDREKNFLPRAEYAAQQKALSDRLEILTGTKALGLNVAWGYFIGFIGVVSAVITWFVHR